MGKRKRNPTKKALAQHVKRSKGQSDRSEEVLKTWSVVSKPKSGRTPIFNTPEKQKNCTKSWRKQVCPNLAGKRIQCSLNYSTCCCSVEATWSRLAYSCSCCKKTKSTPLQETKITSTRFTNSEAASSICDVWSNRSIGPEGWVGRKEAHHCLCRSHSYFKKWCYKQFPWSVLAHPGG